MSNLAKRALFLDRDGIINKDYGYVFDKAEFEFCDGIFELVCRANEAGMLVIVVTNQSGIARGYYSKEQFLLLSEWMKSEFHKNNARIDDVFYCPHHPIKGNSDYTLECGCRKPKSGMFLQAQNKHNINLNSSVMVGDKISDMQASITAGIKINYWLDHSGSAELFEIVDAKDAHIKIIQRLNEVKVT